MYETKLKLDNIMIKAKTPYYLIDINKLYENINIIYRNFKNNWGENFIIAYSVKTNHLPILLNYVKKMGLYAEVVSGDEYKHCIDNALTPDRIIYNGPYQESKTFNIASKGGGIINIDNYYDLNFLKNNIKNIDVKRIKIGLRINFNLGEQCPGETILENEISRFGFSYEKEDIGYVIRELHKLNIKISGLHIHYTTRTRSLKVFKTLAKIIVEIIHKYDIINEILFIDMGGGFWGGENKKNMPTMLQYSNIISSELKRIIDPKKVTLIIEPGSSILSTSSDYISKIIDLKKIDNINILTLDGSILHINPFLIDRHIDFETNSKGRKLIDNQIICGNTCMEKDRLKPINSYIELKINDIITFKNVGAYTMSFNNCFINTPPKIYVKYNDTIILTRNNNYKLMNRI